MHSLAGLAAALITGYGFVRYARAIKSGETLPRRSTWWVFSAEGTFILLTGLSSGVLWTLLGAFVAQIGYFYVLWLLRKQDSEWPWLDKICLWMALILSPGIWILSGSPLYALLVTLTVDFIGCIPTLVQVIREPDKEDKIGWMLFAAASIVNILAITRWGDWLEMAYPLYFAGINCLIAILSMRSQRKLRKG